MNETFETKNIYSGDPYAITPMKFIKKLILRNNKFLFVVAAYIISLATSAISIFSIKLGFGEIIAQFIELLGANVDTETAAILAEIQSAAGVIDSVFLGVALVGLLPSILVAVGCLLIYMGVKKDDSSMACNGTLIFRILYTYHTVVCSLGIAFVVICVLAICSEMAEMAALAIIIGILVLIPLIIANTYYSKFAKMFKNLGTGLRTDINVLKVYSIVTVINWVTAICGIISAASSLGTSFLGSIGNLLTSIALIFVTMMFSEYKDEMGDPTKENIKAAKEYR